MSNAEESPGQQNLQMQQMQIQQQAHQQQQIQLGAFWAEQMSNIANLDTDQYDFKTHQLPLARIKKIMKTDEDVRMISGEAPILFAKACELFILELTLRSWTHTEENKRRTLQRNDIAFAITKSDMFDFLIDIVPRDEIKTAKKGMMDAQMVYQQQLQQQHAAMMVQYMQSQGAAAGTPPNPAMWQQMQAAFQAAQNGEGQADEAAAEEEEENEDNERSTVDV